MVKQCEIYVSIEQMTNFAGSKIQKNFNLYLPIILLNSVVYYRETAVKTTKTTRDQPTLIFQG